MLYGGVVKASTSRLILLDAITINIAASNRSMLRGVELLKQATAREAEDFDSFLFSRRFPPKPKIVGPFFQLLPWPD